MSDPGGDQFSWTCPSCARRVPARVEACRCGFARPASLPAGLSEEPAPVRQRGGLPASILLILGVAAGIAIAVFAVRSRGNQPAAATPLTLSAAPAEPARADLTALPAADALVAPFSGSGAPTPPASATSSIAASTAPGSIEDVVSAALPAVASIDTGSARGSGFFVRSDLVVTNNHVIEGQSTVTLQAGGVKYTARVMTTSSGVDLAVLQVYNPNPNQATLRLGTATTARPGEEVIAIGYALGSLSNTVTRGIVSALRQTGAVTLIQTDAAINPGNSGGPLMDRTGQVIGINSMGISKQVGEGLGFAIAVDHVKQLLAGQTTASSATTPLAVLNQAMGGASDTDQRRGDSQGQLEKVFDWASRNGDQLDASWDKGARTCVAGTVRVSASRAWFAVLEPNGVRLTETTTYDCAGWVDTIKGNAAQIRDTMDKATEAARRGGVYPGTIRDLRRRYRLDWDGWDR